MVYKRKSCRGNKKHNRKWRRTPVKGQTINFTCSLQRFEDFFVKYRLENFKNEACQSYTLESESIENDKEISCYAIKTNYKDVSDSLKSKDHLRLPFIAEDFSGSVGLLKPSKNGSERLRSEDATANEDLNLEERRPTTKRLATNSPKSRRTGSEIKKKNVKNVPRVVLENLALNTRNFVCATCFKLFDTRLSLDVHNSVKHGCITDIIANSSIKFDDQNNPYLLKNLSINLPRIKSEVVFQKQNGGFGDTGSLPLFNRHTSYCDSVCDVGELYQFVVSITESTVMRDRPSLSSQPRIEMTAPCYEVATGGHDIGKESTTNRPIASIVLDRAVLAKRNFVCGVCFATFQSSSALKIHKLFHPPLFRK